MTLNSISVSLSCLFFIHGENAPQAAVIWGTAMPPHLHIYSWGNKPSLLIFTGITSFPVSRAPIQLNAKQDCEWPMLSTSVSVMLEVI